MFKWLLKRKLSKLGLEWVEITEYALLDYRYQVRNNIGESTYLLERKLNRNFQLGVISDETEKTIHKKYGMLTIIYSKENKKIIGITNHKGKYSECTVDRDEKHRLNKIYGIR